jgi:hypothetical protein
MVETLNAEMTDEVDSDFGFGFDADADDRSCC